MLKHAVSGVIEGIWAAGFGLAGFLQRTPVERWASPGGKRVLVLAPHPDDEAAGCAGALLYHRQNGDQVWSAYIADGGASRSRNLPPRQMGVLRQQEAQASASILDIQLAWLGLPENDWQPEALADWLAEVMAEISPDLVYAPSRLDFNPEHHKVAYALAAWISIQPPDAGLPNLRVYPVQTPLPASLVNLICPVDDWAGHIRQVLQTYASQWGSLERTLRMRHYAASFYGVGRSAETFWQISPQDYVRLHCQPLPWSADGFRGVRSFSLTDPLAYWISSRSQRSLARLISSLDG